MLLVKLAPFGPPILLLLLLLLLLR